MIQDMAGIHAELLRRAQAAGFPVGTPVRYGRRTGVVSGVNIYSADEPDLWLFVRLAPNGRAKLRTACVRATDLERVREA